MSIREITPGNSKITLEGIAKFVNGPVSMIHRPATAQEALDLVAELGGSAAFEVVDAKAGWLRLMADDVSIEIMGPKVGEDAANVVAVWEADAAG